jgi:hypothetical protein
VRLFSAHEHTRGFTCPLPHTDAFNDAHRGLVNTTQTLLAGLPGSGAIIDGPWAPAFGPNGCDYSALRPVVEAGLHGGRFVIEAHGGGDCTPTDSCLANFLCAAEEFTYLTWQVGLVPPRESATSYP